MDTVKIDQPMSAENKCPQCGTPLPAGALAGLCPACLLKMGAAADTVTDARQNSFTPPAVAELAAKFPQLEILELIGKGGMGAVYKARQKELDRVVALKILPPGIGDDPAFAERFAREAKALAKLNHPGIVTLFEFGSVSGTGVPPVRTEPKPTGGTPVPIFYFLMEFVDGVTLRQLLHAGRISPREALAIVPQICNALQFAHDQGIVHRDIKPENILLDRRGRVKVADFGLAKIVGTERSAELRFGESPAADANAPIQRSALLTDAGKVMGTPQYMSPEQREHPGEVDHRADIYALGVVFYQMLTGELPGKKIEPPSAKVQIDVRLDEIVLRALAKNPDLRYQQVSEVKTCVETITSESKMSAVGNPKPEVKSRFSRTIIIGLCLIALLSLDWLLVLRANTIVRLLNTIDSIVRENGVQSSSDAGTILLLGILTAFLCVASNILIFWGIWRMMNKSVASAANSTLLPPLPTGGQGRINEAEWNNPRNWTGPKWFSVYFSKHDSRAWVPKQIPALGWTVNLGNPRGAFALFAIVTAIILVLAGLAGTTLRPAGPWVSHAAVETEEDTILAAQPPVVVETSPISGARDVPPGETEIRVRFSKPMLDNSWSWSTAWDNSTPDFIGSPHYEADGETCAVQVKLEPGRTYAFWLNSEKFLNFKDGENRPAIPYLLIFQTKSK